MKKNAMTIEGCNIGSAQSTAAQARDNLALAMAYVPMQCLKNAYCLEEALEKGTLFPELYKPFLGGKGGCNHDR